MPVVRGRSGTGLLTSVQAKAAPAPKQKAKQGSTPSDFTDPIATLPVRSAPASGRPKPVPAPRGTPAQGGKLLAALAARNPAPGTPAGMRKAAAFVAPVQKQKAFEQRRQAAQRSLALQVNVGKLTPGQAHAKLQQAGFIPGGAVAQPVKGVGGFLAKTIGDLATNAVYAPAGIYTAGKAGALDVRDTAQGHPTLKRSWNVAKLTGKGIASDLEHPLRHPGNAALDVFGALSLGAGLGARGVAAAGELGEEGSALSKAGAVGKALLTKPKPIRRTIKLNGLEVHPVPSTNPLMRGVQELHDRALSQGRRVPALRSTREKRVGFELKQEGRVLDPVANAPAAALHKAGSQGRLRHPAEFRAQQMAMRLQATGTTADERIALHKGQIAELGNSPGSRMEKYRHAQAIKNIQAAKQLVDERSGKPVIKDRDLAELYRETAKVAGSRDKLLEQIGLLTPEQIASRVQAEGRVVKGARYEAPTPGKLGKSPALDRALANQARLQRRFDQAYEKQRGKIVTTSRPRTLEEAHARHDALQKEHTAALDKMATEMFGPVDRGEVAYRNLRNARAARQASGLNRAGRPSGASGFKVRPLPTVKQEMRDRAEKTIEALIAANPTHPTAQRWAARSRELEQLKAALNPDLFEKVDPAKLGRTEVSKFVPRSGKLERVGGALSIAKDRTERLQAAAAARVQPTGLVGQEGFTGGEFRVPSEQKRSPANLASGSTAGAGGTVAFPKAPGTVTHSYTGSNLLHARERNDVARLVAESALEANKYGTVLRLRNRIVKASVPVPPNTTDYLPVRLDELKSGKLPGIVRDLRQLPEGAARSAIEQSDSALRVQSFFDTVFPQPKTLTPEAQAAFQKLAEQGKIGWIHKDVLRQVRQPSLLAPARAYIAEGPRGLRVAAGVVPAINRASKAAILYLKPAYAIPNMLGNAALGLVQQGWAAPANLARAALLNHQLHPQALAALDAAVGEGMTAALRDAAANLPARAVGAMANVWGKGVDTPFRRAAFIHEARRYGYRTADKLNALLTDPAHQADLNEVAQRANAALIDYGRLGPLEREIVKHVAFFYSWTKGSTFYAGHFVTEHPAQAALSNELGQQGREQAQREIGTGPSYTAGTFKVGGTNERPTVVNPSGAAILTTPAQVAQSLMGLAQKNSSAPPLSQNLTPALGAGIGAFVTHRDPFTGRQLTGRPITEFGKLLTGGLPQVTLYKGLTGADKRNQKDVLFPSSPRQSLAKFALGSAAPKPMNRAKFLALGEKEHRDTLTRQQKVLYDGKVRAKAWTDTAAKAGLIKPGKALPPIVAKALHFHTLREHNLAAYQDKVGHKLTNTDRFAADVQQLQAWKRITPAKAAAALKWAATATPQEIETQRRAIGEQFYGSAVLSDAWKQIRSADPHAVHP